MVLAPSSREADAVVCQMLLSVTHAGSSSSRALLLQVGGFLQRIDYVRKYAFGAMCILKDSATGQFPIKYASPLRSLLQSCQVSNLLQYI